MTTSTPRSAHGRAFGSRSASTAIGRPSSTRSESLDRHLGAEPPVGRVVLEQVGQGLGRGQVVDGDHLDVGPEQAGRPQVVAADAPEAVDPDPYGHCSRASSFVDVVIRRPAGAPPTARPVAPDRAGTSTLRHPGAPGHHPSRSARVCASLAGSWARPLGRARGTSTTGTAGVAHRDRRRVAHHRVHADPVGQQGATCMADVEGGRLGFLGTQVADVDPPGRGPR